ncbi:Peptidase U32 domain-containing protein [Desulfonema limicola]|uniref:Peptidase U32 domain-containing protein n=1 Tax=Desulfonema limicola TaxID=45656 RepID=A0A975BD99_9BACT|nr:U32 family peptidase [Desulfonema limicola]QTA83065.1 Peptidase U32 domain-containing protein [Desulfonema limicola]
MQNTSKIELLAPAGNFEKLEIAVHYGADAVYLAGRDFSLRNFSGNFTIDEMEKAIALAHENNVKVYVACNIYPRNHEQDAITQYLHQLKEIRPDALIIADPGIFIQAKKTVPGIPVHISTQSNTTNYKTALFWKELGAVRINTARELPLNEIKEISEKSGMEIEAFVHGAMCISYSGRCLLSSFMTKRDSNRGLCSHPCRYNYTVMEEKRPGQYYPLMEDDRGSYVFNSRDLCMVEHIQAMIDAGIDSLKIEGRMKGINYLGTAVKVYREAIDAFYNNPGDFTVNKEWIQELGKISYREYCTGFYFGDPEQVIPNYNLCVYSTEHIFAGKIIKSLSENRFMVDVRNKLCKGDTIEILSPALPLVSDTILEITDKDGIPVQAAQPNTAAVILINSKCSPNDLIRKFQALK